MDASIASLMMLAEAKARANAQNLDSGLRFDSRYVLRLRLEVKV